MTKFEIGFLKDGSFINKFLRSNSEFVFFGVFFRTATTEATQNADGWKGEDGGQEGNSDAQTVATIVQDDHQVL